MDVPVDLAFTEGMIATTRDDIARWERRKLEAEARLCNSHLYLDSLQRRVVELLQRSMETTLYTHPQYAPLNRRISS